MSYTYEYQRPTVTVDAIVFQTPNLKDIEVLLIKRRNDPFRGKWALPGGFLEMDESPLNSALRELQEETGVENLPLKPVFACGEVGRDPRARCITLVFGCLVRTLLRKPVGGDDASDAKFFSLFDLPEMAFDHRRVLKQARESLIWQAKTAIVGQNLFEETFSTNDLQELQNKLTGYNPDNSFIDRASKLQLLIEERNGRYSFVKNTRLGPDRVNLVW